MSGETIRVLHVVQRMEAAGVQSFLMNIYRKIDREKIQFDFLVHYNEKQFYDDEIEALGGKIYRLGFREDKNFIKYIKDLYKFFKEHSEYKIVHGHMDSLGFFYLGIAKKLGVPFRVAHAHTVIKDVSLKKRIRHLINRLYKINATNLFACSEEAGRYMFGKQDFTVIKNPIEVERFLYSSVIRNEVRKQFGIEDKYVLGHIGRFSGAKNHKFLLRIFRCVADKMDNAVLLLVGEGEEVKDIQQECNKMEIDNKVIFVGARRDVEKFYQAMDIFVFPSLYEGLGIVAIEAQTAGLPVVCSENIPTIARITDLFYEIPLSEDVDKWADFIVKQYDTRRKNMYEEVKTSGYDVEDVAQELLKVYKRMVE